MIQTDSDKTYKEKIEKLYINTFSKGISAQFVDIDQLKKLMDLTYNSGRMFISLDDKQLTGAAFVFPLIWDHDFPSDKVEDMDVSSIAYFAELMVDDHFRGKGIGKQLIDFVENVLKLDGYKNIIIRVWDQNKEALHLYQKSGYKEIIQISQEKATVDQKSFFTMNKIYLLKNIG